MVEDKGHVESLLEFRGNFLELLVVAVAIALGINLLAGALGPELTRLSAFLLSLGLVLIGCTILVTRVAPRANRKACLMGMLLVSKNDKKIISVKRYRFSEDVRNVFSALFHENKAIERMWVSGGDDFLYPSRKENHDDDNGKRKRLVREAIEYFVLSRLSTNLTDYFNGNPSIDANEVTSFLRNDIPAVLLSNHFLDVLSKPMEEREVFMHREYGDSSKGKVVYSTTRDGAIFDHFGLSLPRGTQICRDSDNSFSINTRRFSLRFDIIFDGYSGVPPFDFEECYIGKSFDEIDAYNAKIFIDIKFKLIYFFSRTGWQYYTWIDQFIKTLEEDFSFELFLSRISWDTAYTVVTLMRHQSSQPAERPDPES
jgi:hypothetical protein